VIKSLIFVTDQDLKRPISGRERGVN